MLRERQGWLGAAVTCALALVVTTAGCTEDRPQPNLVGQDIRLTIIHTADIHGRLFPYTFVPNTFDQGYGLLPANAPFGGIARVTTLVKRIRASTNRSLWLDSGDAFEGAPVFNEFHGEAEYRALSLAGLEGAVLGNHEFDLGTPNLYDKIKNWARFPIFTCNYAWDPQYGTNNLGDLVEPYQIYDVQGVKVGVIGMGNTDTLLGAFNGGNSLGFRPIADATALEQYVRILRPDVDVVIVVSHLGLDDDEGLTPSEVTDPNEALPLQGIDLILGGHLHIVTNPPKILANDDGSVYCQSHDCRTILQHSGAFAKYVGRLDMVVHMGTDNSSPETRSRVTSFSYINIPVDSTVPDDPAVANLMWPYSVKVNQDIDLNGVFSYVDAQPAGTDIPRNDPSGGDSQLGNLVARSMQVQQGVEAEFSLTNSLGIRDDFYPGPLTHEQMFNVFPFENTIVVIYLSGNEIQETLDFVAQRSAQRGCRTQAQVAGITFDMVCHDNNGVCAGKIDGTTGLQATACATNIYLGENCREGNPDADINPATTPCAPLAPTGLYRSAVNNYIAAGGSGFIVLRRNTAQQDTGVSLRDALTVYMKNVNTCDSSIIDTTDTQQPQRSIIARWGNISCMDETIEAHDGRIRPVFDPPNPGAP
jgi:2',3'-cyclic-nucleotide 2'-phosphodiesterase (5'-nucleotidase family)